MKSEHQICIQHFQDRTDGSKFFSSEEYAPAFEDIEDFCDFCEANLVVAKDYDCFTFITIQKSTEPDQGMFCEFSGPKIKKYGLISGCRLREWLRYKAMLYESLSNEYFLVMRKVPKKEKSEDM